jgi:ABC-type transport system involved in multi-copper enzyme maturation permease subunit
MTDAVRSEWIKLRTTRATVLFIFFAVAAPVVLSVLIAIFGDFDTATGNDTFTATVLGPCYLTTFFAGIVGILGIGQEYRHNTIRVTFTSEPRRSKVLTAKLLVSTLFGVLIGLIALLLCFAVAKPILSSRDVAMGFDNPSENVAGFFGQVVLCGLFTVLGFGLCAAVRQPAVAIPVIFVAPIVVEPIIAGFWPDGLKWLPFQAGLRLPLTGEQADFFSRIPSGLYFGAWVAAVVIVGWVLVQRRDA